MAATEEPIICKLDRLDNIVSVQSLGCVCLWSFHSKRMCDFRIYSITNALFFKTKRDSIVQMFDPPSFFGGFIWPLGFVWTMRKFDFKGNYLNLELKIGFQDNGYCLEWWSSWFLSPWIVFFKKSIKLIWLKSNFQKLFLKTVSIIAFGHDFLKHFPNKSMLETFLTP